MLRAVQSEPEWDRSTQGVDFVLIAQAAPGSGRAARVAAYPAHAARIVNRRGGGLSIIIDYDPDDAHTEVDAANYRDALIALACDRDWTPPGEDG